MHFNHPYFVHCLLLNAAISVETVYSIHTRIINGYGAVAGMRITNARGNNGFRRELAQFYICFEFYTIISLLIVPEVYSFRGLYSSTNFCLFPSESQIFLKLLILFINKVQIRLK
jgi:hypothetical protein